MIDWYKRAKQRLGWTEITVWQTKTRQGIIHNHIEEGHSNKSRPEGTKQQNKAWKDKAWIRQHNYLSSDNVILIKTGNMT